MKRKRNIPQRRRKEKDLAWLASFPEDNPYPVMEIDATGTITYLNPSARETFPGLAAEAAEHPIIKGALEVASRLQHEQGTVSLHEIRVGETIYEQQTFIVQGGRRIRIYMTDITGRKRLERQEQSQASELTRSNEELRRREAVMNGLFQDLQTAKEQIEQQARELRLTNLRLKGTAALKDEFVAKVSHELRTPLTSIKEGLNLLLDNALGETTAEQRDFLGTMDSDIDRLTELVTNMLDLSKIEAGRMRLLRRRLALPPLIDSLVRSYKPLLGHRTVRTESDTLPMVFADANRILQVFSNLLSNAMKFTADDGQIIFRLGRQGDYVSIAVEDTGPGIPPEDMGKLFQKFSQLVPEGEGRPRGTGLGLVVCKELTELHGGRIDVTSEVGRGTTFTVSLPVYTDTLALAESFRELLAAASAVGEQTVALVAIEASALLNSDQSAHDSKGGIERVGEEVRAHVHRGDIVLAIEPFWIVVLAVTDVDGCRAIVDRLHDALLSGSQLRFGVAMYPQDGRNAAALFDHASKMSHHTVASPERSRGQRAVTIETKREQP